MKWINYHDQKPPRGIGAVFVFCHDATYDDPGYKRIAVWGDSHFERPCCEARPCTFSMMVDLQEIKYVTHWMPLPKDPEDKK